LLKGEANKIVFVVKIRRAVAYNKHVVHPVFRLFFCSHKGYKLSAFEREVLWLRERRSGGRGLQAKFVS
jgi:hypothetical protein